MRKMLVALAIASLVALPLAAASSAPEQAAGDAPAVQAQPAATTAPDALTPAAPQIVVPQNDLVIDQLVGGCSTNAYCNDWCKRNYPGSPGGFCSSGHYCICII